MIEVKELDDRSLEFHIRGKISALDYEKVLIPALEKKLSQHHRISTLFIFENDFEGYDVGAILDDAKIGLKYYNNFYKIAVVTDKEWLVTAVKIFRHFISAEVRVYALNELKSARDWIQASKEPQVHLKIEVDEDQNIVLFEPTDALSQDDFEAVQKVVDEVIAKRGALKGLIIRMESFPGWKSLAALIDHLEFVKNHHEKIEKLAFVSNSFVPEITQLLAKYFVHPEIKNFAYIELEKAKRWIIGS